MLSTITAVYPEWVELRITWLILVVEGVVTEGERDLPGYFGLQLSVCLYA